LLSVHHPPDRGVNPGAYGGTSQPSGERATQAVGYGALEPVTLGGRRLLLLLHHHLSLKLADKVRQLLRVLGVARGVCLL
jgi:hypothetical protein